VRSTLRWINDLGVVRLVIVFLASAILVVVIAAVQIDATHP